MNTNDANLSRTHLFFLVVFFMSTISLCECSDGCVAYCFECVWIICYLRDRHTLAALRCSQLHFHNGLPNVACVWARLCVIGLRWSSAHSDDLGLSLSSMSMAIRSSNQKPSRARTERTVLVAPKWVHREVSSIDTVIETICIAVRQLLIMTL